MSLRPDHTAADLRKLMDQFATAAEPVSPAEQANRIRQQLTEMDYGGGRSPSMYGDEEVSWEKGGRRAPTGAFRNPAVVKTDKSIGTRVSDTGPGGKEYNVKTDKEWDKQKGVAEGSREFNEIKTTPYKANQMLGGKDPVAFVIEVLCPDQSVVNMIQTKVGTAYQVKRDDSIEGNGIGIEIISQRFDGGRTAQAAYKQILDIIKQSGGQFNNSTEVTIARQTQGVTEAEAKGPFTQVKTKTLQQFWDSHKDEQNPAPVLADKLKRIRQELVRRKRAGVTEGTVQQLNIQQLATISDQALDNAYHYGRSTPGNTFGWQANLKSAAYAKQMIDRGITDIEAISDAIHKGWNVTARAFVQNPDQFDDTEKLRAAGKLESKLQQRAKLMNIGYAQLPDEEQEKDRVVARALLQALKGKQGPQGVAEDSTSISEPNYQQTQKGLEAVKTAGINLVPYAINPKYKNPVYIFDDHGRYTVVVDMGGFTVPFYRSTGMGLKDRVAVDMWYPFFGIGSDGWFNKGSQDMILDFYGSKSLKNIASILDSNLKPARNKINVAGWNMYAEDIDDIRPEYTKAVNNGLNPVANADTKLDWIANINNLLKKVNGSQYKLSTQPSVPAPSMPGPANVSTSTEPVVGKLTLSNENSKLDINLSTTIGRSTLKRFGDDYKFYSENQFTLEKTPDNQWKLIPDGTAPNKTMINGRAVLSPILLTKGMRISVGNPEKKTEKLPLIVMSESVAEGSENNPVVNAITRRIMMQRSDLLSKYGPEKVGQAVDEVADFVGDVEEIGSSDVSGWVRHVEQMLGNMEQGVSEGRAGIDDVDTVGFSVNSEAAYNAVMRRFGDSIDLDETSGIMYTPSRLWPEIEMVAFDADPDSGAVRVEDDVTEVKHFKTSYGYAGGSKPSGGQYRHPEHAKADSAAKKTVQAQQKNKQSGVTEGNLAEDSIRPNLAAALKGLGFKGPFRLGQLPKWMAELQLGLFGEDTSIMIGGDDPEYDPWVAKGYDYGYAYGIETGYQKGLSAQEVLNNAKSDIQNLKDVAEAESEKSEMDTPAVQGAIARMRQRHEKEPFDLKKAQALGQKLAARNRDPRRK